MSPGPAPVPQASEGTPGLSLAPSTPSPNPAAVKKAVLAELAAHGKSWTAWTAEVSAFRAALKQRLDAMPAGSKALAGSDGFLFFSQFHRYVLGGDLAKQSGRSQPAPRDRRVEEAARQARCGLPVRSHSHQGRDFSRQDLAAAPGDPALASFAARSSTRSKENSCSTSPTRASRPWTCCPRSSPRAARVPVSRSTRRRTRTGPPVAWNGREDRRRAHHAFLLVQGHHRASPGVQNQGRILHPSRRSAFAPARGRAREVRSRDLGGHQVVNSDGTLYEDDPDSPIVILGDSFTGVYELMDCEHGGVSAHLARRSATRSIW